VSRFKVETSNGRALLQEGRNVNGIKRSFICLFGNAPWAVFLILVTSAQAQVQFSPNLLKNGSFENPISTRGLYSPNPPDYWSVIAGANPFLIQSGQYANYLPATDGSQLLELYGDTISQSVTLVSGIQYAFSFDLSTVQGSGQDSQVTLSIGDGAESLTNIFTLASGTASWAHESYSFTAEDSGLYAVSLASPNLSQYASVIDNASLEAVPEPSDLALAGAGIAILRICRRKSRRPHNPTRESGNRKMPAC
jgi:Protein of unknown function (DUF642)